MTLEGLQYMNSCLEEVGVQFEFMEWTSVPVPDPYWVMEYTEVESVNEDGYEESTIILTGTTKQKYYTLETVKQKLKEYFPSDGRTAILESGSGIAVSYSDSYPVPSIQEGVHRLQINLRIKEWMVE